MAIITFKSNELKETGQTLSISAIATQMAIEHNRKILLISTSFKDQTLENCFWEVGKTVNDNFNQGASIGVESGIEGLIRVIASNKTSPEIIKNYSKIILRDRLDILPSPKTQQYSEYEEIALKYPEVLKIASMYYDIVLVDLSKRMSPQCEKQILEMSDIVVTNMTQRLKSIDEFAELREKAEFYKRKNIMLLIGRYDAFSKYNVKNITRYLRERNNVSIIPYNTLYFEACSEGKIIDFFLGLKTVSELDRNYLFIKEVNEDVTAIFNKLQELQMRL